MKNKKSNAAATRGRIDYLDGLRAVAALYVVAGHACLEYGMSYQHVWLANIITGRNQSAMLPSWLLRPLDWLILGHIAVCVFIVLSGYCLALPIAKSENTMLPYGIADYFKRRARRILPPYYAALGLMLLFISILGPICRRHYVLYSSNFWVNAEVAFTPHVLWSHLLMVHNLSGMWWLKIDYPMWSVATECQIYLIFPLLIAVWRRIGIISMTNLAFAISLALAGLITQLHGNMRACPWFVGLFALGVFAAFVNFSKHADAVKMRAKVRWGMCCWAVIAVTLAIGLFTDWLWTHIITMDLLAGAFTMCLLIFCTDSYDKPIKPMVLRFLELPILVWIGTFSYSLYLIHVPVLALVHWGIVVCHVPPVSGLPVIIILGLVLSTAAAYLFHIAFERPFLTKRRTREERQTQEKALAGAAQ